MKKQMFLFLLVGLLNTLFSYTLFAMGIYLNIPYPLAIFFAYTLGIFFSYFTFQKGVFKHKPPFAFFRFIIVYLFLYGINVALVRFIHTQLPSFPFSMFVDGFVPIPSLYFSGFFALAFTAVLSFFLNRFFVFEKDSCESS